ncbi:hypothetical protein [Edaphobacter sp.]|nr:hypothetical protein [Edaphobacter sp.]
MTVAAMSEMRGFFPFDKLRVRMTVVSKKEGPADGPGLWLGLLLF